VIWDAPSRWNGHGKTVPDIGAPTCRRGRAHTDERTSHGDKSERQTLPAHTVNTTIPVAEVPTRRGTFDAPTFVLEASYAVMCGGAASV
jgi:hypothetical protein